MKQKPIADELAEKTLRELGITIGSDGKLREIKNTSPVLSRKPPVHSIKTPFRIPAIEKTTRQAASTQGYKASGYWQTASLLRDLIQLYLTEIPPHQFRRKTQLEDAARSMVSTFEEGWARPTTKELLDYIGFSQGSLTEVRGDIERLLTDGYLPDKGLLRIPTPSREFPYPPVNSRKNPTEYGTIRERLREYTGHEVNSSDLTYAVFYELINKTDYLLKKVVVGLQNKIVTGEKDKINTIINTQIRKYW